MKLTDKRFWITWTALTVLMVIVVSDCSWNDDTAILGIAFMLSLLSTWLCHRVKFRVAFNNLLIMLLYNAILGYNLIFNGYEGAGFTWWLYLLLLNGIHSIGLLIYYAINVRFTVLDYIWYVAETIGKREYNNMTGLSILLIIWCLGILIPLLTPLMYWLCGNPTTIILALILCFLPFVFCRLRYTAARKQMIEQHYSSMKRLWRRMFMIAMTAFILAAFNFALMFYFGLISKKG